MTKSCKFVNDFRTYEYLRRTAGGWRGCHHYSVTLFGFEEYCKAYVDQYTDILNKCAGLIANKEVNDNYGLRDNFHIPLMVANHIIRLLEDNGYVKVSDHVGERISIWNVSVKLKRELTQ